AARPRPTPIRGAQWHRSAGPHVPASREAGRHPMAALGSVLVLLLSLVVLVVGSPMMAGQVQAAESCHRINAKGVGQDLGGGNTTARIAGGGLLHGTTAGHFEITGGSPPVFSIAGTVTFTTHRGTLTVAVTGTFDVASGAFAASGPVTASTGKLAGATG